MRSSLTEAEALRLIEEERCIARVIVSDRIDDHHWNFLLDQFKDTPIIPAPRELDPGSDSSEQWDFYRKVWIKRNPEEDKSSTPLMVSGTLLPHDGRMYLYNHSKINQGHEHVAALFDAGENPDRYLLAGLAETKIDTSAEPSIIKACFAKDAGTNTQWWIKGQPLNAYHKNKYPEAISFTELRKENRSLKHTERDQRTERNEVLFVPRKPPFALGIPVEQNASAGVNATYRQLMFLEKFNVLIPIIVIDGNNKASVYTEEDQARHLYDQIKDTGDVLAFRIHALIARLDKNKIPSFWAQYEKDLQSFLDAYLAISDNSSPYVRMNSIYHKILAKFLFRKNKKITIMGGFKEQPYHDDKIIEEIFIRYAGGDERAQRTIEMLELIDESGFNSWRHLKTWITSDYPAYLKSLHRFPSEANARSFLTYYRESLPKKTQITHPAEKWGDAQARIKREIQALNIQSPFLESMLRSAREIWTESYLAVIEPRLFDLHNVWREIQYQYQYQYALRKPITDKSKQIALQKHTAAAEAVATRKLWTDIVSLTDDHYTKPPKDDKEQEEKFSRISIAERFVLTRMQELSVSGDHALILKNMLTYLQEHSAIVLAFNAAKTFSSPFVGTEPLNAFAANDFHCGKGTTEKYREERDKAEQATFDYLPNYYVNDEDYKTAFKENAAVRPRYAFLILQAAGRPIVPRTTEYGKSYVVLQHHMKFNSLFVPHNIYANFTEAKSKGMAYTPPTPCTYFTMVGLIQGLSKDVFLGLIDAVTGSIPDKRLSSSKDYELHAYIPPVDLLDKTVTKQLFIHPDEYLLSETEKHLIKSSGISVVNEGAHLEEKVLKKLEHTYRLDKVVDLQIMQMQYPQLFVGSSFHLVMQALRFGSIQIYRHLKTEIPVSLGLNFILRHTENWNTLIFFLRELLQQAQEPLLLNSVGAMILGKSWFLDCDAATKSDTMAQAFSLLPNNEWEAEVVEANKPETKKIFTIKQFLIMHYVKMAAKDKEAAGIIDAALANLYKQGYLQLSDFVPYFYKIWTRDLKETRKIFYGILGAELEHLDKLVIELLEKCAWDDLLELQHVEPHLFIPTKLKNEAYATLKWFAVNRCKPINAIMALCAESPGFIEDSQSVIIDVIEYALHYFPSMLSSIRRYYPDPYRKLAVSSLNAARGHMNLLEDSIGESKDGRGSETIIEAMTRVCDFALVHEERKINILENIHRYSSGHTLISALQVYVDTAAEKLKIANKMSVPFQQTFMECESHYAVADSYATFTEVKPSPHALSSALQLLMRYGIAAAMAATRRWKQALLQVKQTMAGYTSQQRELFADLLSVKIPDLLHHPEMIAILASYPEVVSGINISASDYFHTFPDLYLAHVQHALHEECKSDAYEVLLPLLNQPNPRQDVIEKILYEEKHIPLSQQLLVKQLQLPNPDKGLFALMLDRLFMVSQETVEACVRHKHYQTLVFVFMATPLSDSSVLLEAILSTLLQYQHPDRMLINMVLQRITAKGGVINDYIRLVAKHQDHEYLLSVFLDYPEAIDPAAIEDVISEIFNQNEINTNYTMLESFVKRGYQFKTKDLLSTMAQHNPMLWDLLRDGNYDMRSVFVAYLELQKSEESLSAYATHAKAFNAKYGLTAQQQELIYRVVNEKFPLTPADKQADLLQALAQQDYVTAIQYIHLQQPGVAALLEHQLVESEFEMLKALKNQTFTVNLLEPNLSEIESHLFLTAELVQEMKTQETNPDLLLKKIPVLIQSLYAVTQLKHAEQSRIIALRSRCAELLNEASACLTPKAEAPESEITIEDKAIKQIIDTYHQNKYHWFGRKAWCLSQSQASAALLQKLEDKELALTEKQKLITAVTVNAKHVGATLFKAVQRNLPLQHKRSMVRARGGLS